MSGKKAKSTANYVVEVQYDDCPGGWAFTDWGCTAGVLCHLIPRSQARRFIKAARTSWPHLTFRISKYVRVEPKRRSTK